MESRNKRSIPVGKRMNNNSASNGPKTQKSKEPTKLKGSSKVSQQLKSNSKNYIVKGPTQLHERTSIKLRSNNNTSSSDELRSDSGNSLDLKSMKRGSRAVEQGGQSRDNISNGNGSSSSLKVKPSTLQTEDDRLVKSADGSPMRSKPSKQYRKEAMRVSKLINKKLENYFNQEKVEERFNTQGYFRTTKRMAQYDIAYKVLESTELEKNAKARNESKKTKEGTPKIDAHVCPEVSAEGILLNSEAQRISHTANQIFESLPIEHLAEIHRFRPHPREGEDLVHRGHVQNYNRHSGAALKADHYVQWYIKEGLAGKGAKQVDEGENESPSEETKKEKKKLLPPSEKPKLAKQSNSERKKPVKSEAKGRQKRKKVPKKEEKNEQKRDAQENDEQGKELEEEDANYSDDFESEDDNKQEVESEEEEMSDEKDRESGTEDGKDDEGQEHKQEENVEEEEEKAEEENGKDTQNVEEEPATDSEGAKQAERLANGQEEYGSDFESSDSSESETSPVEEDRASIRTYTSVEHGEYVPESQQTPHH